MTDPNPYWQTINPFGEPQSVYPLEAGYVPPQYDSPRQPTFRVPQQPRSARDALNAGVRPTPSAPAQPTGPTQSPVVDDAFAAADQAAAALDKHIGRLSSVADDYSQSGLDSAIKSFTNSPEMKALDDTAVRARLEADAAAERVAEVRDSLAADGDAAEEMRRSRYWERSRRTLEAAGDAGKLAQTARDLIFRANPTEIGVLMAEMPSMFESKKIASGWLNEVAAQRVPALGDAQRQATLAEKAAQVALYNRDAIRQRIAQTNSPSGYRPPALVGRSAVR